MVPDNQEPMSDENFEEELFHHLKRMGLAFPETMEELDHFLNLINKEQLPVPDSLPTGVDILRRGLLKLPNDLNDSTDGTIEDYLAQAAREGKTISDEVLEKMKRDRQKSEGESEDAKE